MVSDDVVWESRMARVRAILRAAAEDEGAGGAAKPANCGYVADHLVPSGIEPYAYSPDKAKALLHSPLEEVNASFEKVRARRSLRDVESKANLWVRTLSPATDEEGGA